MVEEEEEEEEEEGTMLTAVVAMAVPHEGMVEQCTETELLRLLQRLRLPQVCTVVLFALNCLLSTVRPQLSALN